jgi:hypothetical protein
VSAKGPVLSDSPHRKNIFLTDENVDGPAIELARVRGVDIVRNVDIELECELHDYDQCLFDYAVEHHCVLVTGNIKHFEPKVYKYAETGSDYPGIIFIHPDHQHSHYLIADWLELLKDEDMLNRVVRIKS